MAQREVQSGGFGSMGGTTTATVVQVENTTTTPQDVRQRRELSHHQSFMDGDGTRNTFRSSTSVTVAPTHPGSGEVGVASNSKMERMGVFGYLEAPKVSVNKVVAGQLAQRARTMNDKELQQLFEDLLNAKEVEQDDLDKSMNTNTQTSSTSSSSLGAALVSPPSNRETREDNTNTPTTLTEIEKKKNTLVVDERRRDRDITSNMSDLLTNKDERETIRDEELTRKDLAQPTTTTTPWGSLAGVGEETEAREPSRRQEESLKDPKTSSPSSSGSLPATVLQDKQEKKKNGDLVMEYVQTFMEEHSYGVKLAAASFGSLSVFALVASLVRMIFTSEEENEDEDGNEGLDVTPGQANRDYYTGGTEGDSEGRVQPSGGLGLDPSYGYVDNNSDYYGTQESRGRGGGGVVWSRQDEPSDQHQGLQQQQYAQASRNQRAPQSSRSSSSVLWTRGETDTALLENDDHLGEEEDAFFDTSRALEDNVE